MTTEHESTITIGRDGYPAPENARMRTYPKKETTMNLTPAQKILVMRFVRGLAATVISAVAVWLTGPAALGLIHSEVIKAIVISVLVPALLTANKALRLTDDEKKALPVDGGAGETKV